METVKRNFDTEASAWDNPTRMKLAVDVFQAMSSGLFLTQTMSVLDFGCGTGLITLPLALRVHTVTGVDSSKGMLEVLSTKVLQQHARNIQTMHLDLSSDDVLSGSYDAIVSSMTLHHIKDTSKLLKHFYEALQPGGQIALADLDAEGGKFHDHNDGVFHFGFDRAALGQLMAEAGFSDVHFTTATQMHKPDAAGNDRVFSVFLVTGKKL